MKTLVNPSDGDLSRERRAFTRESAGGLPLRAGASAKILLVTGVDYPGHLWRDTAPILKALVEEDRRLDVRVVEDPHVLDSAALQSYDAVLLHFMNWECPSPGEGVRANLRRFVASGHGLAMVHFACGAWQDWAEFRGLAGRVWDPKLRGHDPRGVFHVNIQDADHDVTAGLKAFETDDELYTCLVGDRSIHVLANARSKVDGKEYPMGFVFPYGQGRVFQTPLGHDTKAYAAPGVRQLIRQGCAWAAGLERAPAP